MKIIEFSDYLFVCFKAGTVSVIVKEIRNAVPLTKQDAEALYAELSEVGKSYHCRYFRVIAHGGFLPEALDYELYGLTVSDGCYLKRLRSGNHVELFPHNEAAYRAIERGFEQHRIGAVVQATGTGKSYLLARYIVTHATDRILVIAPNVTILNEIRRAVGSCAVQVVYRTFQALVRAKGEKRRIHVDHILIDEFHHFGASIWGEAVQEVIECNPVAKVLGTSATPVRPEGMIDTVDVYFEGNLFYELTLPAAWYYGILPVPILVQGVYGMNDELDRLQKALDRSSCSSLRRDRIQKKLDAARIDFKESLGASNLIREFLPHSIHKLLVFCADKEDLHLMQPEVMIWLKQAGFSALSFEVHNGQSDRENRKALKSFSEESGCLHVLFSINMLIEGLHVDGVEAALFLRRTESYVVTLQQLGRCLNAGSQERPVILDLVNNLSGKSVYDVMSRDLERLSSVHSPRGFVGVPDFEIRGFISDIRQRVDEILSELEPWQIMYERLLEYHISENDWPSVTDGKLGLWCNTQRIAYKKGTLSSDRISLLEKIGFEWEYMESRWSHNYELLNQFYQLHGRWPKRGEGSLSTWCNTQRQARKNGKLTKERIRRLDRLGFVWEQDLEGEWKKNYEEIKLFCQRHARWPKAQEGSLGAWCCTQRKMYRMGELSDERVCQLNAIGFQWSSENVWAENYNLLKQFYLQEQRWPTSREGRLGSWCFVQKRNYRKGVLSKERIRRLEQIGFKWSD